MASTDPTPAASPPAGRGPIGLLLDLFSSVRLGIVLLAILFVYMSVGSAGVIYPTGPNIFSADSWTHAQIRQWRPFEKTEFEWFHWWPFDLLMLLIAINIVVTTLRRIPFKPVNYGVWGIHGGVITMLLGCWLYFGTKVEGDAMVARRQLVVEVVETGPDGKERVVDRVAAIAKPGQQLTAGSAAKAYHLTISSIDPNWSTGGANGETAYAVNVDVQPTGGKPFIRQLVAGHPERTEDLLQTGEHLQPLARATKATGKPLVDESIRLSLDYEPQRWFYLRPDLEKSFALYVREAGTRDWTVRPIHGMPLYNDRIASRSDIMQVEGQPPLPIDPLDIAVPPVAGDPFPQVTFHVTGYLRYAVERSRLVPGPENAPLNPAAVVVVRSPQGQSNSFTLEALDPARNNAAGMLAFRVAESEKAFEQLLQPPTITFRIPSKGIEVAEPARPADSKVASPFKPLGTDTGYFYRIVDVRDDLALQSGVMRIAFVDLKTPKGEFRRWVFEDPRLTRDVNEELLKDMSHGRVLLDDSVEVDFTYGHGEFPMTLVVGPSGNQFRMITAMGAVKGNASPVEIGKPFALPSGITFTVADYLPRAVRETKPMVVPYAQRNRDAGVQFAMADVEIPGLGSQWLPFHLFTPDSELDAPRGVRFEPTVVQLADGKRMEILFGRQRMALPAPVVLDDFSLATHIGGFTGSTSTIRDYQSVVRFKTPEGEWGTPHQVSMNRPIENNGFSYFQSQWDPPDPPRFEGDTASAGLNHTVLGVGNRNGVGVMLWGTIIACLGMIYAFYFKPIIKRRQREAVFASVAASGKGKPSATRQEAHP